MLKFDGELYKAKRRFDESFYGVIFLSRALEHGLRRPDIKGSNCQDQSLTSTPYE